MTSWSGFTRKLWIEITQKRIPECKGQPSHSERLRCLLRLYDEINKDGMAAYAIGGRR